MAFMTHTVTKHQEAAISVPVLHLIFFSPRADASKQQDTKTKCTLCQCQPTKSASILLPLTRSSLRLHQRAEISVGGWGQCYHLQYPRHQSQRCWGSQSSPGRSPLSDWDWMSGYGDLGADTEKRKGGRRQVNPTDHSVERKLFWVLLLNVLMGELGQTHRQHL